MKVGIWLCIATCKYIMLICLNTIKQYIFALVKSIPLPFEILPTHTSTHMLKHISNNKRKNEIILLYLGKKNEIEILEIITTKAATTFNHFMTLNEMEMVCLRNEFFHPATTQRYMQNLFYCFCQPKSSTHNITSLCDARLN